MGVTPWQPHIATTISEFLVTEGSGIEWFLHVCFSKTETGRKKIQIDSGSCRSCIGDF